MGTTKTFSVTSCTISTWAWMPISRPLSAVSTRTLAPKVPWSLATGSIWVSVPVISASPVASLLTVQLMPVERSLTSSAETVISTVRPSVSWMVATVSAQVEPTVAFSAVMVPLMVAVRVQSSSVSRRVVRLSGTRWACSSRTLASSTCCQELVSVVEFFSVS